MKLLFTVLFWLIGYKYSEGEKEILYEDVYFKKLYAHKYNQTKEQGIITYLTLGKYGYPFKTRYDIFKVCVNPNKYLKNKK